MNTFAWDVTFGLFVVGVVVSVCFIGLKMVGLL